MQIKGIEVNGRTYKAFEGEIAPDSSLVFIMGEKGFIMCGYLNMETAEKKGNIAAIAVGVKTVEDMLQTKIAAVSSAARKAGIEEGMPVKKAIEKL
ncbi:MAG: DUF1805 domain-containing protein [Endomicrobia bacterium]|nr:DUF1805 domain-containing protein [Endomicrobiia bacterium]